MEQDIWIVYERAISIEELTGKHREYFSIVGYASTEKEAKAWVKKNKEPFKGFSDIYSYYEIEMVSPLS